MTSLEHNTQNDTRLEDWNKFRDKQAALAAAGEDSLPNFAIGFTNAVHDEVLDIAKDANGDDAAAREFAKYASVKGRRAVHNRSSDSVKSQVSKLRVFQKAASNPKFDAPNVLNRAVIILKQAKKDNPEIMQSAYDAYRCVMRDQLKQDDELEDDQIYAAMCKPDKSQEPSLEKELRKAAKILEGVITGEKHPGIIDQSPEVLVAAEQLNQRIQALELKAAKEEAHAKALELGIITTHEPGAFDETNNLELAAAVAA